MTLSARRAIPETTSGDPTYIPVPRHAFQPVADYSHYPAEQTLSCIYAGQWVLNVHGVYMATTCVQPAEQTVKQTVGGGKRGRAMGGGHGGGGG